MTLSSMKNIGLFVLLAAMLAATGCTKMNRPSTMPVPDAAPGADTARVYFVMPSSYPAETFVLNEKKLVGYLTNRQWFYVDVPAGQQMFMTVNSNTTVVDGELEAGKSYYVKVFAFPGFGTRVQTALLKQGTEDWDKKAEWLANTAHMELVPESAAKWEAKYAKHNENRLKEYEEKKYKSIQFAPENAE